MKIRRTQTALLTVAAVSSVFLAGCSSPETLYYTLSVPPQGSGPGASSAGKSGVVTAAVTSNVTATATPAATPTVTATAAPSTAAAQTNGRAVWNRAYRISSVTIPAQVDDTPLVVRQSSDQLMVLTFDRWTGPLKDQFQDALSQALTRDLGMPPVQNLNPDATRAVDQIHVDVQRFDLLPGQAALLDVVWQISPGAGVPVARDEKGEKPQARQTPQARPRAMTSMTCYSVLRTPSDVGVAALVLAQQRNVTELAAQIAQTLRTGQPPGSVSCI